MAANKTTPLPPWASAKIEPKREFKFILTIGDIPAWVVLTAQRPDFTVSAGATHQFLGHTFKYPGRLTWNQFQIKLVEPIDPDVSGVLFDAVKKAGYVLPSEWSADNEGWLQTFSKNNFTNGNLGDIAVKALDSAGNMVEKWTLRNAWISGVNYGDLNYGSEALTTVTVTFQYDFADLEVFEPAQNNTLA
tara:strand:+ start:19171 stop:19740 length:570 start_codon:yes stop_codon:yes gene_type:complete